MNTNLLRQEVQDFINQNLQTDNQSLIFKKSPFEDISMREIVEQIQSKKRIKHKLPSWFNRKEILYPPTLNLEQSSSEITANYKQKLVPRKSQRGLDMTGGLGVDTLAFCSHFQDFDYCEINPELFELTKHNTQVLGARNIQYHNKSSIEVLKENKEGYDFIFVDPSRRNDKKGKVFLLEDCLPNLVAERDFLAKKAKQLLIKNSPMLDIQNSLKSLRVEADVHVIAVQNEVKEVLLDINWDNKDKIYCVNFKKTDKETFIFSRNEDYPIAFGEVQKYLYEPNAAIMKAGGYKAISHYFNLNKLHPNTHLFTSDTHVTDFPGRIFEVQELAKVHKKGLQKSVPNKKANISIRNYPSSVKDIRKKTGIQDGGEVYIFCTTLLSGKTQAIICKKI